MLPFRSLVPRTEMRLFMPFLLVGVVGTSCTPAVPVASPQRTAVAAAESTATPAPSAPEPDTAGAYAANRLTRRPKLLNRLEMLHAYRRLYPPALLETDTKGQAIVQLVIDEKGVPLHAGVLSSTQREFNAPSVELARMLRFRPGLCGKEPVRVRLELPIKWNPDDAVQGGTVTSDGTRRERVWFS